MTNLAGGAAYASVSAPLNAAGKASLLRAILLLISQSRRVKVCLDGLVLEWRSGRRCQDRNGAWLW
jgi:hypothetical protein